MEREVEDLGAAGQAVEQGKAALAVVDTALVDATLVVELEDLTPWQKKMPRACNAPPSKYSLHIRVLAASWL